MACLDTTTKSLTIELSSSPTAQADWTVHYGRKNADGFAEVNVHGATNNTAQVTMVSPPVEGETMSIRDITVFNNDNSAITFKIRLFDGLTSRVLYAQTLNSQEAWSSLAQKGRDGAAGATGTVNAASGLILDESSAPNTIYNQGAIYVNNNELFFRRENNAQPFPISGQREVLTADRTYYVRTDGNDSNDGLSDSAGGAFLTIQKAIDVVAELDVSRFTATIKVGSGTFNSFTVKYPVGSGGLIIEGDTVAPANVIVGSITISGASPISITVRGFQVNGNVYGMRSTNLARLNISDIVFAVASTAHIRAEFDGNVVIGAGISFSGSSIYAMSLVRAHITLGTQTITFSGTPLFTDVLYAANTSTADLWQATWSGAVATGTRKYSVITNSVVNTYGGNTIPGNVAGVVATGGQYS